MSYTKPVHYTRQQLVRFLMQDLINDQRADKSDVLGARMIAALFKARHSVQLDRYGWPKLPEFKNV